VKKNSRHRFDAAHPRKKSSIGLRRLADGQIWVDQAYEAELDEVGLATFDAVMRSRTGRLLRTLPDRENWRLELGEAERQRVFYLKKHRGGSLLERVRLWFGPRRARTPGRTEAENVAALKRAGIESMRVVAFGERMARGVSESFFMTEELRGFAPLDDFVRWHFVPAAERTRFDGKLRGLALAVADVARRFHAAGFNHRDFYCCHLFIQELPDRDFAIRLIDLQRVEQRRWFRRRWIVKDLAQLAYSAPRERITRSLRMAFIKRYLGIAKLGAAEKRLIRRILRRQRAMERRLGARR